MPSHQERREPLPKGYRFGDAASLTQAEYRLLDAAKRAEPLTGETFTYRYGRVYQGTPTLSLLKHTTLTEFK